MHQLVKYFVTAASVGVLVLAAFGESRLLAEAGGVPRFFLLSQKNLDLSREAWLQGDVVIQQEMRTLLSTADASLSAGPFSVVFSTEVAPSGDPHDLVSYGIYAWPNPDTPDGLPWIARDGFPNLDNRVDWIQFDQLNLATEALSLGYYFTGDERYAKKSAELLRTWFLDPQTHLNPRNEFSDVIPGRSPGSFSTPGFASIMRKMLDSAGILEASPHWSAEDKRGLQDWIQEFTVWAETSDYGRRQRDEPSNHGTNYDLLLTLYALYNEDLDRAEANYLHYVYDRMPGQIDSDGSNPLEMQRANNLLYSRFNLGRMLDLGNLGAAHLDSVDLLTYTTDDGRGPRLALDFLLPYMLGIEVWDRWPGPAFALQPSQYYGLLRIAAVYYHDPLLLEYANSLGYKALGNLNLRFPNAAVYDGFVPGDANLDDTFDSSDIVQVFQQGLYEQDVDAAWRFGDWNGDWRFNSRDLIDAWRSGSYQGNSVAAAVQVPEPQSAYGCSRAAVLLMLAVSRRLRPRPVC